MAENGREWPRMAENGRESMRIGGDVPWGCPGGSACGAETRRHGDTETRSGPDAAAW